MQVRQVSEAGSQQPSPQDGEQSAAQLHEVSGAVQQPSPQEGEQSVGQLQLYSPASQLPSLSQPPQSSMQLAIVSPSVHTPSPQSDAQSPPFARLHPSASLAALQQPFPHTSPQESDGQLQWVSPESHVPSLHCGSPMGAWQRYVVPNTWHVPTGQAQSTSLLQFIQPTCGGKTKKQQPSLLLGSGSQSAGQLQAVSPGPSHTSSPSHSGWAVARTGNARTRASGGTAGRQNRASRPAKDDVRMPGGVARLRLGFQGREAHRGTRSGRPVPRSGSFGGAGGPQRPSPVARSSPVRTLDAVGGRAYISRSQHRGDST
jgi:hypothetical protein